MIFTNKLVKTEFFNTCSINFEKLLNEEVDEECNYCDISFDEKNYSYVDVIANFGNNKYLFEAYNNELHSGTGYSYKFLGTWNNILPEKEKTTETIKYLNWYKPIRRISDKLKTKNILYNGNKTHSALVVFEDDSAASYDEKGFRYQQEGNEPELENYIEDKND